MKKTLLTAALLLAIGATAQNYEWQWAKRGGGTMEIGNSYYIDIERIHDIAVDSDNNYYYMAYIGKSNTEYDGTPVTVYNTVGQSGATNQDIVLISTDCEGNLRWTQTIGGGVQDFSYALSLDDNGGLYLGAMVINVSNNGPFEPPHFTPDDALPEITGLVTGLEPHEGFKYMALLKYNTADGILAWRVMPQGDVTSSNRYGSIHNVHAMPDGTVHTLMAFDRGTHLNGQFVVPDADASYYKMCIVKYNSEGEIINVLPLSFEGAYNDTFTQFNYDPVLDRYYLSGNLNWGAGMEMLSLSFNGVPFTQPAFVLAFTGTGQEVWRREMTSASSQFYGSMINSLTIDVDSNIYLTGKYFVVTDFPENAFHDYQMPTHATGNITFTMKLNPDGEVQWVTVPTSYTESSSNPLMWTGNHLSYGLAIRGNEVAVATQVTDEVWGTITADRPQGYLSEPALLRLNKETGEPIAIHDIWTSQGFRDGLSAVAVDNDGNYIVGGYFFKDLFILENDNVPTVTKVNNTQQYTDFFIAKLAATECGTLVRDSFGSNTKTEVYPNPTSGVVNINTQEDVNSYRVINMLGQVLQQGRFEKGQSSLSVETLQRGTYILKLETTGGKVFTHKIVKD